MAERSSALDSSSDVARMWVRIPAWPVAALVFLSKTLNHNCFVLRMGRKAVSPVCCVMHVKEPMTLIVKEKGLAPVFLDLRLQHPEGCICACYKSYNYHHYYYYLTCESVVYLASGDKQYLGVNLLTQNSNYVNQNVNLLTDTILPTI